MGFKFRPIGDIGNITIQEMTGDGKTYIRIAKVYVNEEGERLPTKQGVSIPIDKSEEFLDLIEGYIQHEGKSKASDKTQSKETELTSDITDIE